MQVHIKILKKAGKVLEPESWLYILFILASLKITAYRPYLILIFLFILGLYLVSRNLTPSVWLVFVGSLFFRKAKFFARAYPAPEAFLKLADEPVVYFFIAFSDALLLLFLYIFRRVKLAKFKKVFKASDWLLLLLVLWGMVTSCLSKLPEVSWFWLGQLTKYIVIFYLASLVFKSSSWAKKTIEFILVFSLFNALLIVLQKLSGGPLGLAVEENLRIYGRFADESRSLYRPGGISWDANLSASMIGMVLPLLVLLATIKNNYNKLFLWISLLISNVALVLTASRAVWLGAFVLLMILYKKVLAKRRLVFPYLVRRYWVFSLVLLALFLGPMVVDRLGSLGETVKHRGGAIYRWRHLVMAFKLFLDQPWGIGLNVFQYQILDKFKPEYFMHDSTPAHNLFAQVGVSLGLPGLVIFGMFLARLLKKAWFVIKDSEKHSLLSIGLAFAVFSYLLFSQIYPWFLMTPISELFWLLAGAFYAEENKKVIKKN